MKLVVVESPAKAKTINKYLGQDYIVLASYGHIRDLPSKEGSVIPEQNFQIKYALLPKSDKHVNALSKAATECSEIILATDPDREGEGIAWHVVEMLKENRKIKKDTVIKRIVFTEITKTAIKAAIANPRDIDLNLVDAQQARRALDYLFGFTLSPILWRKLPGCKSAGRVQSVALRIVCEREKEIRLFKKQEYWDITAGCTKLDKQNFTAKLAQIDSQKLEKFTITKENDANEILQQMSLRSYSVASVEKKQQKRHPLAPFITSTLQQDASRKLGFNTKKTMQLAQKLYEGINVQGNDTTGLITYMRTDGVTIAGDALESIRNFIKENYGSKFLPQSPRVYKAKSKNAQEAHEAIRPTDINLTPEILRNKLDPDMHKLYSLIWKHTVACQMESALLDIVTAKITSNDNKFVLSASGSTLTFKGFYAAYTKEEDLDEDKEDKDEDEKLLPPLEIGEAIECEQILPKQHFTEPPARYNEASLIKKLVELGIGRPSTYAAILSVIQDRKYVKLDARKRFVPEAQGIVANAFLTHFFHKYVEYDFTASLEEELDQVAEGKLPWKNLLENFWQPFNINAASMQNIRITEVLESLDKVLFQEIWGSDDRSCPSCKNAQLSLKTSRFGAFYSCSAYPGCSFVMNLKSDEDIQDVATTLFTPDIKAIAHDPTDLPIYLKKGPYGWYLQVGDTSEPGFKRVTIPNSIKPQDITPEQALKLTVLPRIVGHDPSNNPVTASIGKFGPFLKYAGTLASIPKDKDIFTISIDEAWPIIEAKSKRNAEKQEKMKEKYRAPKETGENDDIEELPKVAAKATATKATKAKATAKPKVAAKATATKTKGTKVTKKETS